MKVVIDIDIDISNNTEQRFLEYFEQNPLMTKTLLLCGYLMVERGVCEYYDEKYSRNFDNIWKDRYEKTLQYKDCLEQELKSLGEFYENRYARLYELKVKEKEEEICKIKHDVIKEQESYNRYLNGKCEQLEQELKDVKRRYEERLHDEIRCKIEVEARIQEEYRKQNEELTRKCTLYENEYKNALQANTNYALNLIKDSKVKALEEENTRLLTELSCLKNTNVYKGQQGEKRIRNILAEHFTDCEILDTSKTGGLSDVHLVTKDGDVYVFESKNKATISAQDVEKSYADVDLLRAEYGDRLKGYVFVSHKTRNIPKKGNLYIECIGNMHIVWVGVNESDDVLDILMVAVMRLLMSLRLVLVEHSKDIVDIDRMMCSIKEKLEILMHNINLCSTIQENITSMSLSLNHLQNNNKELYNSIMDITGIKEQFPKHSKSHTNKAKRGRLQCSQCDLVFNRKCDLTQHLNNAHRQES